jgi:hypothetical protein
MPNVMPLQAADPRRVGHYRLTGRLDSRPGADGSTPRVFMAKIVDDGEVIVTLLGGERVADAAARDRFTAEAQVARRVAPFCTARILDAGIEAHDPYLVTEHIPGSTLIETVWREGPLTSPGLDTVAIGTATGLMAIHQTGLVHGSLGPDRVVLGPDGPCLTHFGITPPYGAATPAADLLAWANTVLFAALGRPPVGPQDLAALPEDLREVVAACLAPDPTARPVARAVLTRLLTGHDLSAGLLTEGARQAKLAARMPEIGPAHRSPAPARSRSGIVLWSVACVVCVLAIAAGAVFIFVRPHQGPGGQPGAPVTGTRAGATRLPTPLPSARAPATLTGSWSGQVHQTGPALTVSVRISLPASSATGTISYPQLGCSGKLAIVAVARRKVTLDQTIASGRANCPDGVITLVSRAAGSVTFTFLRANGSDPTGTLTHGG